MSIVPIRNKYENECANCHATIQIGELVLWDQTNHNIKHIKCTTNRKAYLRNDGIALRFEKNPHLIGKAREIGRIGWKAKEAIWLAKPTQIQAKALIEFLLGNRFEPTEEVIEILIRLAKLADENFIRSSATQTDFAPNNLTGTPYTYQNVAAEMGINNKRIIVADDMGVGKSLESLVVAAHLNLEPFIIVCPAIAKGTWLDEISKWTKFKGSILEGRNPQYGMEGLDPRSNYIINYDILNDWLDHLVYVAPKLLILDEAHYIRNHKTQRARAVLALAKNIEYILALTGTPIINGPMELINLFRILGVLDDFGGFKFFIDNYREPSPEKMLELNKRLRYSGIYIRRNIEDVAPFLPDKPIRQRIPVDLSNRREYNRAEAELARYLAEERITDNDFLDNLDPDLTFEEWQEIIEKEYQRTHRKVEAFKALIRWNALGLLAAQGKIDAVIDWIYNFLDSGEKLTVFAYYREIQNRLLKEFPNALHILSTDSSISRSEAINEFQKAAAPLIICSLKAANVNITLTAGHYNITTDLGWTPADHQQAEARQHRLGQSTRVWCGYFVGKDTIDEERFNIIDGKLPITEALIKGVKVKTQDIWSVLSEDIIRRNQ